MPNGVTEAASNTSDCAPIALQSLGPGCFLSSFFAATRIDDNLRDMQSRAEQNSNLQVQQADDSFA